MSKYNHTELFELVRWLLESNSEKFLRECIEECHNGRLIGPIDNFNLHLFRRYRNSVSPNAQALIDAAVLG